MLDILKKFNAVEQKTKITECGSMPSSAPSTPVSVNLSAPTAQDMAQMLRALANIESGEKPAMAAMPMAMAADAMEAEYETDEAFVNEPDEEYADHNFMTKDLSGGINRQKTMYKPAAKGDNPMAVESIKDRLYHALNEKKAKPDFLDMDKDGNKKEPMKKAVADKKKKAPVKESSEELEEANYISDTFIQHLKIKYNNKTSLSNSEKREVQDLVKRMSNDDKKKLAAASIRYVSDAAKDYIKRYIPSNMVRPTEAITNWKGEEVDPQVGDIVRLYGGGHRPIKGVIVGPGNGRFEGSFAIKFKNLRGDIVVDSFYAKDEFEIIQKASTNEAKKTKPDFLDMDKDGNKKEPMKKAVADKKKHPFKK